MRQRTHTPIRPLFVMVLGLLSAVLSSTARADLLCRDAFDLPDANAIAHLRELGELRDERTKLLADNRPTDHIDAKMSRLKREAGVRMINESISETAVRFNRIILRRSISEAMFSLLERSVTMKPLQIKIKSLRSGPAAGYIPRDPILSQPNISPRDRHKLMKAVEKLIERGELSTRVVTLADGTPGPQILTDPSGHPFVADVDLWGIGKRNPGTIIPSQSNKIVWSDRWGWASAEDLVIMRAINRAFKARDLRTHPRDLVPHGPWIASPENEETDYPLTVYMPNGEIFDVPNRVALEEKTVEWTQEDYIFDFTNHQIAR